MTQEELKKQVTESCDSLMNRRHTRIPPIMVDAFGKALAACVLEGGNEEFQKLAGVAKECRNRLAKAPGMVGQAKNQWEDFVKAECNSLVGRNDSRVPNGKRDAFSKALESCITKGTMEAFEELVKVAKKCGQQAKTESGLSKVEGFEPCHGVED